MRRTQTLAFLYRTAGPARWCILLLLGVQAAAGVCVVGYALVLRAIVDAAVAGNRGGFLGGAAALAGLLCLQLALRALQRFLEEFCRSKLENRFKLSLYRRLLTKSYASVTAVHSGEWINRLTSDTVVVANGLTEILPGACGMGVRLVGAVVAITLLEPRFLWLVLPAGAALLLFSTGFRKKMKQMHKVIQEKDGALRVFLQDTLGSLLVVRSYAVEEQAEREAGARMESHRRARMRRNAFSNVCNIGFGAVMNGACLMGAVFCGLGILTGTMSYGTFTAVLQLISQVQAPFANLSGYLPRAYAVLASAERLLEVESFPGDAGEARSLGQVREIYRRDFIGLGLARAMFAYSAPEGETSDRKVVDGLDLEIRKGAYVAFVGSSGCGKSTALKLLMGLYPLEAGECYLRLRGERVPLDTSWQRLFAYVPQGNHLMSGTIREVVSLAHPEKAGDEAKLWQALDVACAGEFVRQLERGLDTPLGERGAGLSEGQMQRLAIARAIFSEHPILMLDECTSALDEDTERRLLTNLRQMTEKTVVIVTHRPQVLDICDTVVEFSVSGDPREEGENHHGG